MTKADDLRATVQTDIFAYYLAEFPGDLIKDSLADYLFFHSLKGLNSELSLAFD